ncbi:asparagine synthase (glutamine-hydrolyzing) [Micromonospora sp. D93]|uniref:asparagine synthase (glutamine-hydrolyzing) n=1 Tax=Micromonospora sp. D93 TaxID=2824886 RepID=UPI001B37FFB8|nr:asparagine synthase (glutamine-hydrolyzing) [Micromonospora sp. D93]MBQ1019792.1 asparagine synthase (glutamine-hydrolyzing) [Micromonospora sp. D93]
MCGVAGWVQWASPTTNASETVISMTSTLTCRGPDDVGIWQHDGVVLGHRRLSIIDPSAGHQPMIDNRDDPRAAVVFGGEIYNFRKLRHQLARSGATFRTDSDTEVVLRAYLQWGAGSVEQLEGMFAIAIWDVSQRRLTLIRDRVGVKPLYYLEHNGGVLFGSEPKAILASPLAPPEVDNEGLAEILAMWPYKTPGHAIYKRLCEVRPGEVVSFESNSRSRRKYWTPPLREERDTIDIAAERVRALLTEAVASHLVSDVPLCSLLSGGIDSTSIAALATRQLMLDGRGPLSTYSVDFLDAGESFRSNKFRPGRDAPFVTTASTFLGSHHTNLLLSTEQILQTHRCALEARDLPDTVDMDASLFLLFRKVAESFKVALSGEGADELFGGYPWYRESATSPVTTFPWTKYLCLDQSLLLPEVLKDLRLDEYRNDRFSDAIREVPPSPWEDSAQRQTRIMNYLDLTRFLPGQLERKDRMSMANGVEARVPFCDRRLIEYAWNLPYTVKLAGGAEKGILRRAMAGVVPTGILRRPKASYPTTFDPAYESALRDQLAAAMRRSGPLSTLVDRRKVLDRLNGDTPEQTSRPSVWMGRLVSLDNWLTFYRVRLTG